LVRSLSRPPSSRDFDLLTFPRDSYSQRGVFLSTSAVETHAARCTIQDPGTKDRVNPSPNLSSAVILLVADNRGPGADYKRYPIGRISLDINRKKEEGRRNNWSRLLRTVTDSDDNDDGGRRGLIGKFFFLFFLPPSSSSCVSSSTQYPLLHSLQLPFIVAHPFIQYPVHSTLHTFISFPSQRNQIPFIE
jgi:hypothetical protein